jgi:hypothetical protein
MKSIVIAAAVASLLAGAAQAAVTELVIYKDNDFNGARQVVKGEVSHLEEGFARAASSAIVRGGYWEVCNRSHFKGDCRVLAEGEYAKLGPEWSKRIVSVRFLGSDPKYAVRTAAPSPAAAREAPQAARTTTLGAVDLYVRPDFRGQPVRVHDNVRDVSERNLEGRASSAIVHEGTWVLCSEPGFHGRCAVLAPGQYAHLADLDYRVGSLRQLR